MPPDLYPIRTHLALLRDVAAGRVWRNTNGHDMCTIPTWPDDRIELVTARIAELVRADWVILADLPTGARRWHLTDAGRAHLGVTINRDGKVRWKWTCDRCGMSWSFYAGWAGCITTADRHAAGCSRHIRHNPNGVPDHVHHH